MTMQEPAQDRATQTAGSNRIISVDAYRVSTCSGSRGRWVSTAYGQLLITAVSILCVFVFARFAYRRKLFPRV